MIDNRDRDQLPATHDPCPVPRHASPPTWVDGEHGEVEQASLHQLPPVGVGVHVAAVVDSEQLRVIHAVADVGRARRDHLAAERRSRVVIRGR